MRPSKNQVKEGERMAGKEFEGKRFVVKKAFRRGLENGDQLQIVLECPYTRQLGMAVAEIDGLTVDVRMKENNEKPQLADVDKSGGE
jgi:hypothetical protein